MVPKTSNQVSLWKVLLSAVIVFILFTAFSGVVPASNSGETYEGLKIFTDVIDILEKNYVEEVDTKEMINKAIEGMVHSLDPHSQLLPPEAYEELHIDTEGEFGGIGIVITMQNGLLTVISPIEGTPAYRAGVKAGDIIAKVDGEPTKDMMLWEAVKKMRGPKGEKVVITIVREGISKPLEFTIIRDIIPIVSVKNLELSPGYAYIRITNFQKNTTEELLEALDTMDREDAPLQGLILDLRDNPGGLLDQAIEVSDVFLEEGTIVSIKGRYKRYTREYDAADDGRRQDYPIAVLINGGSASASEIVSGALQDQKRAVIVGTTSFGKGSVQTVEPLRDGYGLKFTIARYYTPNGRSIQAQGIVPDIEIKQRFFNEDSVETADESGLLKEKDLKNHLEPVLQREPIPADEIDLLNKQKRDTDSIEEDEDDNQDDATGSRYGPLKLETLQADNQIMRSLDILKSYHVFKALKN